MDFGALDDYILITVRTNEGAYIFLCDALGHWNELHGGLIDYGFKRERRGGEHAVQMGTAWVAFNPELSPAALDDLDLVFEPYFAPQPMLFEYVPAFSYL